MTSDTMKVDWYQPIEAVHKDGRVVEAWLANKPIASSYREVCIAGEVDKGTQQEYSFYDSGIRVFARDWTIRNKPPAAVAPASVDEWGPAIEVGGVRPEWIDNSDWDKVRAVCFDGDIQPPDDNTNPDMDDWRWDDIKTIQLPAHHPHYIPKPPETPATGPNEVFTGTERLERLEGFLRRLAGGLVGNAEAVAEAKALLPIDPDLIKAREIATEHSPSKTSYIEGDMDDALMVKVSLAGIKAGRELGK